MWMAGRTNRQLLTLAARAVVIAALAAPAGLAWAAETERDQLRAGPTRGAQAELILGYELGLSSRVLSIHRDASPTADLHLSEHLAAQRDQTPDGHVWIDPSLRLDRARAGPRLRFDGARAGPRLRFDGARAGPW